MMESSIQTIGTIDLDGFQVVKAELFAHLPRTYSPSCTLWPSKICFNKQALQALNNCETVLIQVNAVTKGLVVMPVHSRDKDAVRWVHIAELGGSWCGAKRQQCGVSGSLKSVSI